MILVGTKFGWEMKYKPKTVGSLPGGLWKYEKSDEINPDLIGAS